MATVDAGPVQALHDEIKALASEIQSLKDVKGNEDLVLIS